MTCILKDPVNTKQKCDRDRLDDSKYCHIHQFVEQLVPVERTNVRYCGGCRQFKYNASGKKQCNTCKIRKRENDAKTTQAKQEMVRCARCNNPGKFDGYCGVHKHLRDKDMADLKKNTHKIDNLPKKSSVKHMQNEYESDGESEESTNEESEDERSDDAKSEDERSVDEKSEDEESTDEESTEKRRKSKREWSRRKNGLYDEDGEFHNTRNVLIKSKYEKMTDAEKKERDRILRRDRMRKRRNGVNENGEPIVKYKFLSRSEYADMTPDEALEHKRKVARDNKRAQRERAKQKKKK